MPKPLPVDAHVDSILAVVRKRRAVVVVAPPGAGKTTRIPPALADDGPLILLQPRRVAARSLARRIASERGWTIGREIGWQVRMERRFSEQTRLLVATEGVLTARLQNDPLLEDFRTVVLDEFHERSLHADLALALARQASRARGDLRLVVMSATLDAAAVADFLDGCPIVEIPGRSHPVEIEHAAGLSPADAVHTALGRGSGHVLCFLPGAPEIRRVERTLRLRVGGDADVLPLYGALAPEAQDRALAPSSRRKLILCTNIAETSITVEGVSDVVDSGLHKLMRLDTALGIDRLETERIALDSAVQRAGRAGRTGPGRAMRLWDAREQLREHTEPEIERVDLTGPLLDVLAWGGNVREFEWFEPPPAERVDAALELLERLGAVAAGRITELGKLLRRFPLHPRLARAFVAGGGLREIAAACAALTERWRRPGEVETTRSDLLVLADHVAEAPAPVRAVARELERLGRRLVEREAGEPDREERLLRALFAGYPDRLARRREGGSNRLVLASGHGAVLARDSGVRDAEFLVAIDVVAGRRGPGSEALVRMASAVERGWLSATRTEASHVIGDDGRVRAVEVSYYGRLPIGERPVPVDPEVASSLLAKRLVEGEPTGAFAALLPRLRFAGFEIDLPELAAIACVGRDRLSDVDLAGAVPREQMARLARLAPETVALPSGRRATLEYAEDGRVFADVKLQELFGLDETPRLGPRGIPVTLRLLAPNGRPVQTTQDLRSFWETTYPEVRRELRGRYPKHPWPEDPWSARPTARTNRRRRK